MARVISDGPDTFSKPPIDNTEERHSPMKRWHLVVAAIFLASVVGLAQGGRGQQSNAGQQPQRGGVQGRGGNGGGRGGQSTADLAVVDGWGNPVQKPPA